MARRRRKPSSPLRRGLRNYLVVTGVAAHAVALVGGVYVLQRMQEAPQEALVKAVRKAGVDHPWLVAALSPSPKYAEHRQDGRLAKGHPRILLPELRTWKGGAVPALMRERLAALEAQGLPRGNACKQTVMEAMAVCWVMTADADKAEALVQSLKAYAPKGPDASREFGRYGNAWRLALAYDLAATYPGMAPADRVAIEQTLAGALEDYLRALDSDSPSMWHGRTELASIAWLLAAVLDPERHGALIGRAQGHFLDAVHALELTEAWPEGYSYWIQNRAYPFVLAAAAYLNGLEGARHAERVRKVLQRVGRWHIYITRPDHRAEGYGDEGSRVDLKDMTGRVVDIIAQVTGDRAMASYGRYIRALHGQQAYYRAFRWGIPLFLDPSVAPLPGPEDSLAVFEGHLPRAELFGRGAMNLGVVRSGWQADDTYVTFRMGDFFTHHGHYDAGHFSLFKGAPLAINSSSYGGFRSPNRLNYSIRTVAKNSLLILRPGETVRPNGAFKHNVAGGGQRIVMPTGSAVQSVRDWMTHRARGPHYEAGEILGYGFRDGDYAYVSADITDAYNTPDHDAGGRGGKAERVRRSLAYLFDEDRLLVYDQVRSTEPAYRKKWLLHTVNRPSVDGLKALKGDSDNGILESTAARAVAANGEGRLVVQRLFPRDGVIRLVGGPDYQFYVEADGDDGDLDGESFGKGASLKRWFDIGLWRMEIQAAEPRQAVDFLVALSPSLEQPREESLEPLSLVQGEGKGVVTPASVVLFSAAEGRNGRLVVDLPASRPRLYVFGLPELVTARLRAGSQGLVAESGEDGVAVFSIGSLEEPRLVVSW